MPAEHPSRPTISTTQLMSSALAAVTAAVVGSRLGIAGTLAGAAAGSVIGTAGTAMYAHWLDRTATRVRTVVRLPTASGPAATAVVDTVDATDEQPTTAPSGRVPTARRQPTWRTVGLAAVATFAIAIGSITAFEAITGEPVSTITGGDIGSGTTLGRVIDADPVTPEVPAEPTVTTPAPTTEPTTTTPTPTSTPTATSTPTVTPTETPTTPPPTSTPPTTPTPPPT